MYSFDKSEIFIFCANVFGTDFGLFDKMQNNL